MTFYSVREGFYKNIYISTLFCPRPTLKNVLHLKKKILFKRPETLFLNFSFWSLPLSSGSVIVPYLQRDKKHKLFSKHED